MGGSVATSL